ncbi:MAG: VOC family protein [Alphaproteobacteria bacterium]|nr:VOC family protein [Alphaproteobacteria bacterium SS10]
MSDAPPTDTEFTSPSIISHVSVGTNDFDRAVEFYDAVMPVVGAKRLMTHPGAAAYGKMFPEFWVQTPFDEQPAVVGNGQHFAFIADSKAVVDAFHAACLKAGATDDGPPGPRPLYGEPYYGCFLRDLDGNKIEATFWDHELAAKLGMG